jgi:uncharacterized protein YlxW (UPF0749 family)
MAEYPDPAPEPTPPELAPASEAGPAPERAPAIEADPALGEYTPGRGTTWRVAVRRAATVLAPRPGRRRRWSALVPAIAALAGLLFTTSARTSAGTNLRDDRRPELTRLIAERLARVEAQEGVAAGLRTKIDQTTAQRAVSDGRIDEQTSRAERSRPGAGFTALRGPGLTVRLDDAPRRPGGALPAGARPDDVVVHQQDVQSAVNALWAGGAEAMVIMGIRVISTSAVRCVGNTLLLHGRVFSPPFEIKAIGDPDRMRAALDTDAGVRAFRDAAEVFGLGYAVVQQSDIVAPAYSGSVTLDHAVALG